MDIFDSLKNKLLQISSDMTLLFKKANDIPGLPGNNFESWKNTCDNIQHQLPEEIVRVAVVGPIKSGKSTFVNSLFKGDYLKRGAGVITSIVTRIRGGHELKATLHFKSWDEVNADIEQALSFFPSINGLSENSKFDIREGSLREDLADVLSTLSPDQLITNNKRNINSVVLSSYLKGYDRIKDIDFSKGLTLVYDEKHFSEHRYFAGDEVLAVYLKDIQLEIDSRSYDKNVEIADCQGSDSPNPLHLVMIQDYLLMTHMLIYVISSRTGLREADIKFLSMIKKMGIMDNILFVVNCDFSEHDNFEGFQNLIEKIKDELSLLVSDPEIYTFSALYNLFRAQHGQKVFGELSSKDLSRLEQWTNEDMFVNFSDKETIHFESNLNSKITKERYPLLLRNHLERLKIIALGLSHWIHISLDILEGDSENTKRLLKDIRKHQKKMNKIKAMIKNTLDGGVQKVRLEIRKDVDRIFDRRTGEVVTDTLEFIKAYSVSYDMYEDRLESSGFTDTLFIVFQEFKQALDTFMAETINPKIIGFLKKEELKIIESFKSIADPFSGMVEDAISEYQNAIGSLDASIQCDQKKGLNMLDMTSIKNQKGLHIPPAIAMMRYSARIKTEAIMRLGFYSVIALYRRIFKKADKNKKEEAILALKHGVKRMKYETEQSILFHMKNFQENIKFQYLFKLTDAVSDSFYEVLLDSFHAYITDLSQVTTLLGEKRIDKERVYKILHEMETDLQKLSLSINGFSDELHETGQNSCCGK